MCQLQRHATGDELLPRDPSTHHNSTCTGLASPWGDGSPGTSGNGNLFTFSLYSEEQTEVKFSSNMHKTKIAKVEAVFQMVIALSSQATPGETELGQDKKLLLTGQVGHIYKSLDRTCGISRRAHHLPRPHPNVMTQGTTADTRTKRKNGECVYHGDHKARRADRKQTRGRTRLSTSAGGHHYT